MSGHEPTRTRLPRDRDAVTHKFSVSGHEGYITVGMYEDGRPGEVFLRVAKAGSTISGLMDIIGVLASLALQYGVPVGVIVEKLSHAQFEPSGVARGHPGIPRAVSLVDYIGRWLGLTFLDEQPPMEKSIDE